MAKKEIKEELETKDTYVRDVIGTLMFLGVIALIAMNWSTVKPVFDLFFQTFPGLLFEE